AMRQLWASTMYERIYSETSETVTGDVNADNEFTVADLVTMQNWLIGNGTLDNWKSGDLNKDNVIDVFDLCMMKKLFIQKK
nr:dockerin type I repeat-containing protein [Ruminococcus sp.]